MATEARSRRWLDGGHDITAAAGGAGVSIWAVWRLRLGTLYAAPPVYYAPPPAYYRRLVMRGYAYPPPRLRSRPPRLGPGLAVGPPNRQADSSVMLP